MASNFLETATVNHNFREYGYEKVLAELNADMEENNRKIAHLHQMAQSVSDTPTKVQLEAEYKQCLDMKASLTDGLTLIKEYPEEFPVLYSMIAREDTSQSGVKFELNEVLAHTDEIVTEAQDVMPKGKQLELTCELPDAGKFGIVVTPYDKAGENDEQFKARINFEEDTVAKLNEARLKTILEFCEKKGISVYDMTFPYKDGLVDVDEKLFELTQQFLQNRREEDAQNSGPTPEDDTQEKFVMLEAEVKPLEHSANDNKPKKAKKEVTLADMIDEMTDFIENDLKKTKGFSYFVRTKNIDGLQTYVFSLYDKPNRDNEKLDGKKDKNGFHVPTYAYRLYVAQNPKTGKFSFGYATPGGKKMDDTMAGDFVGVMKKTGVTHLHFHNVSSANKGVWMMACAEKGIVPIGISLNTAKARAMVEVARKKLSTEEFVTFKYRLADQMLENAQNKCKDKSDPNFGLSKSERDFISGLKTAKNFDNFRIAYEDGLYGRVLDQIDIGSKDSEKGAATTFGSMRALKSVFDIYFGHHDKTFGQRLAEIKETLPQEEYEKLLAISPDKKMVDLSTQDFVLIYDTILDRHIQNAETDILQAYSRELKRKPRRADGIVLASDLFPRAKGAVNEINITLSRNGIDTLTLPLEHKGLEFARPDELNEIQQTNTNQQQPLINQGAQNAR